MRRIVLNVAEKPSIAKTIMMFLKQGDSKSEQSASQYNPIFNFRRKFMTDEDALMKVTSVTGHIMEIEFDSIYSEWSKVDPLILIQSAQIHRTFSKDKRGIVDNLKRLSREATDLVLWLDCDREGEAIAYEVLDICMGQNRSLFVHRARFSAATRSDIERAFNNLKKPEKGLSDVTVDSIGR
jgi:DNA topoisomerase-3